MRGGLNLKLDLMGTIEAKAIIVLGWVTYLAFEFRCTLPLWLNQLELARVSGWIGYFQPTMWNPWALLLRGVGRGTTYPRIMLNVLWKEAIFFEVPLILMILISGWHVESHHLYLSRRVSSFQVCVRLMVPNQTILMMHRRAESS